jgi:hypothetical protein
MAASESILIVQHTVILKWEYLNECKNTPVRANVIRAPVAHGGFPHEQLAWLYKQKLPILGFKFFESA